MSEVADEYFHMLKDGVILGADTRATEGPIVADKNCEKIHYMAPNIYCCGAGTAADTEAVTGIRSFTFIRLCSLVTHDHLRGGSSISLRMSKFFCMIVLLIDMVSSQLKLHRFHAGRESRVVTALTLLKSHLFR